MLINSSRVTVNMYDPIIFVFDSQISICLVYWIIAFFGKSQKNFRDYILRLLVDRIECEFCE